MTDFDELKQTKAQCLRDITEALPDYVNRLNSIDTRLLTYIQHRHATADVYRRRYLRQCQPRQPHGAARHPQGNATSQHGESQGLSMAKLTNKKIKEQDNE